MVVLGDSISTGFNASSLGDNLELSWVSGSDPRVQSHAQRFQSALQIPVEVTNVAVPGSKSKDLMKQWRSLELPRVDYASITIGANDVCEWRSKDYEKAPHALIDNVERVLQEMTQANPSILINLMPLPNLLSLQRVASNNLTCRIIWDVVPICKKILRSHRSSKQREDFQMRIDNINLRLEMLSQRYPNTRFYRELSRREFTFTDLSKIDCFHPSRKGHRKIAEASWELLFPGGDADVRQLMVVAK